MRDLDFEVQITSSALATVSAEVGTWRLRETGGILIGYWSNDQSAVITHAVGPGPSARHSRFTFEPDSKFSQEQLNLIYWRSGGQLSYIGDWHTHPMGSLVPSESDSETTFGVAADPDYRVLLPILLLCRQSFFRRQWQARAFVYSSDRTYYEAVIALTGSELLQ